MRAAGPRDLAAYDAYTAQAFLGVALLDDVLLRHCDGAQNEEQGYDLATSHMPRARSLARLKDAGS